MTPEQDERLKNIERILTAHDSEEDQRYIVDTGRQRHLENLIKSIDEADPAAIATAVKAVVGTNPSVNVDELARKIVLELGKETA